jgi:hypothetical protein
MLSEPQLFEKVMFDIKQLSLEKRLLVIKLTSETLLPRINKAEKVSTTQTNPIRFGEYKGTSFTSEEDFKITEWQPTDEYLRG